MALSESLCWHVLQGCRGQVVSSKWFIGSETADPNLENSLPLFVIERDLVLRHARQQIEDSLYFLEKRGYLIRHGFHGPRLATPRVRQNMNVGRRQHTVPSYHSSPNHVVWEYFFTLRRLAQRAQAGESEEPCRQATALTIIMAVTVVEVFLNLFFRVCVSEPKRAEHQAQFLEDLRRRISLDQKIRKWPKRILGHELPLDAAPGKHFMELKDLRNLLIHFTSTHTIRSIWVTYTSLTSLIRPPT